MRLSYRYYSCVLLTIYLPGTDAALTPLFFNNLTDVLERDATYASPIFVIGDLNVRFDRADDPHAEQLRSLVSTHGLMLAATDTTHARRHCFNGTT